MNIAIKEIEATLVRLQGQIDVWQALYQAAKAEEQKAQDAAAKENN